MNSSKIKRYVGLIESSNVYDVAQVTPVTKANQLSKLLKNEVLLKREDLQKLTLKCFCNFFYFFHTLIFTNARPFFVKAFVQLFKTGADKL